MNRQVALKGYLWRNQPVVGIQCAVIIKTTGCQTDGTTVVTVVVIHFPIVAIAISIIDQPTVELFIGLKIPQHLTTVHLERGRSVFINLEGDDLLHLTAIVASHSIGLGSRCLLGHHRQSQSSH